MTINWKTNSSYLIRPYNALTKPNTSTKDQHELADAAKLNQFLLCRISHSIRGCDVKNLLPQTENHNNRSSCASGLRSWFFNSLTFSWLECAAAIVFAVIKGSMSLKIKRGTWIKTTLTPSGNSFFLFTCKESVSTLFQCQRLMAKQQCVI